MQIFIDTANIEAIKKYTEVGIVDGVTTSPAIIANEDVNIKKVIAEICEIVNGPISVEVISTDVQGIIREATAISNLHPNIVVKIPAIPSGYEAMRKVVQNDIKVNMTMIYTANQALIAAKLGAKYVSPFVGRLEASSTNGTDLVREIITIFNNYEFDTKVLAASMRNINLVKEAALAGAHAATIPPAVLKQMMESELTEVSLKGFLEQWQGLSEEKRDFLKSGYLK